jgi:hypothetical protein
MGRRMTESEHSTELERRQGMQLLPPTWFTGEAAIGSSTEREAFSLALAWHNAKEQEPHHWLEASRW